MIDDQRNLIFKNACPRCVYVHQHAADDLRKVAELHCSCGAVMEIGGNEFAALADTARRRALSG